jgi:hypothetical protein
MKIHPLGIALSAENSDEASNVNDAKQVLIQNTTSSGRFIHIKEPDGAGYESHVFTASFYLPPNQSTVIPKDSDEEIFSTEDNDPEGTGANDVLFTKLGRFG